MIKINMPKYKLLKLVSTIFNNPVIHSFNERTQKQQTQHILFKGENNK